MKKTYEKPALVKQGLLSKQTADACVTDLVC